jgi:hypothetical protein
MYKLRNLKKFNTALIAISGVFILSIFIFPNNWVIAASTVVLSEINFQTGDFRDLKWGRHISECEYMIYQTHKQTSGGNVKIYKRDKDHLRLDNKINLSNIEYGFLNSRLLFVALKTTGKDNQEVLKKAVILRFGNNNSSNSGNLFWVVENTSIIFQTDKSSNHAVLLLVSKDGLSTNFKN